MAKQYHDLFREITSFENLHLAFRKAMRGKRANPRVAAFELAAESELVQSRLPAGRQPAE